jgi:hypothetical protein
VVCQTVEELNKRVADPHRRRNEGLSGRTTIEIESILPESIFYLGGGKSARMALVENSLPGSGRGPERENEWLSGRTTIEIESILPESIFDLGGVK